MLELISEIFLMFSFAVLSAIFYKELCIVLSIVCLIWAFWINNRRAAYVEKHIYGDKKRIPNQKPIKNRNKNLIVFRFTVALWQKPRDFIFRGFCVLANFKLFS